MRAGNPKHWALFNQALGLAIALCATVTLVGCNPLGSGPPRSSPNPLLGRGLTQIAVPADIRFIDGPKISLVGGIVFYGRTTETESNIYRLDPTTDSLSALLPSRSYYPLAHPTWKPSGDEITFSGYSYKEKKDGVWRMRLGADPAFVSDGLEADWSSDESQLVVVDSVSATQDIKIVNLATRTTMLVFTAPPRADISDVSLSPDRQSLAFVMNTEENGYLINRLYRLGVDGTNLQPLFSEANGSVADPQWIQQGKWIALLAGPGLDYHLAFVRADGKCNVSPLLELHELTSGDITNDGATAVVTTGSALYRLDVNAALAPKTLADFLQCP
jgi:dipeptidyl aminopeptidase/acylaminoacyl peptidase